MKYQKDSDGHVIILSAEETDKFFEPFDPNDTELPSHLHYSRHRFIYEDVYNWLTSNIGEPYEEWSSSKRDYSSEARDFKFRTAEQAMRFKLVWS